MPMTINGIGTMYYGKRNLRTHPGVCESCKRSAQLSDYETTLFFVVLYIPLIPLGRKQLLNACSNCRRHAVLPAKRWQKIKQSTLEESTSALAEQLDRPEAALQHLHTLAGFGEMEEARDLAEAMENQYANAAGVLFSLGAWHEHCGHKADADRCFQSAFRLDPENPAMIRAQGLTLMEQGQLDEARGLLSKLAPPHPNSDPTLFSTLGKAFQQRERHAEALELFAIAAQTPGMKENKTFQQLVRKSERATGRQQDSLVPKVRLWQRTPIKLAAGLALLVGLWGLLTWVRGQNRTVHIVNSSESVLEVRIDSGQSVLVQPGSHLPVSLAEGAHRVTILKPEVAAGEKYFQVETPLWQRAFVSPSCLLDPLEASLIYWQKVWYHKQPNDADDAIQYHHGQLYVQYPRVDYLLRDFPAEIRLRRGRSTSRTGLNFEPLTVSMLESSEWPEEKRLQQAERLMRLRGFTSADTLDYVGLSEQSGQIDRAKNHLASLLNERPVIAMIHRAYQSLIRAEPEARKKLSDSYDRELAADPSNADLWYLRSCLETDYDRAQGFLLSGLKENPNHQASLIREAYLEYCRGNYAEAVETMERNPAAFDEWSTGDEIRFAAGRYSSLIPRVDQQPAGLERMMFATRILHELGLPFTEQPRTEQQEQLLAAVYASRAVKGSKELEQTPSAEIVARIVLKADDLWLLLNYVAYLEKDSSKLTALLRSPPRSQIDGYWSFVEALENGSQINLVRIVDIWGDDVDVEDELLIAIRFRSDGDTEQADSWLESVCARLSDDGPGERRWAELLRRCRTEEIDAEEVQSLLDSPDDKAIYTTALAAFSPKPPAALIELARRFNYKPTPPHRFLDSVLNKLSVQE